MCGAFACFARQPAEIYGWRAEAKACLIARDPGRINMQLHKLAVDIYPARIEQRLDRTEVFGGAPITGLAWEGLTGYIGRDGIDQAWPEGVAAWKAATPLARYASAEEVVGVTEFLLSDGNAWATGSTYDFDGGLGANSW